MSLSVFIRNIFLKFQVGHVVNSSSPPGISFNSPMISNSSSAGSQALRLHASKKRLSDKKTCRWVLDNGTICGRTFSKFDR